MTTAFVGLGANLASPRATLEKALDEINTLPSTHLVRHSSFYRSAPIGYAAQPDFINAVAEIETDLTAHRLLEELHTIESRHGRERRFPNAPRTLDLDILLYGDNPLVSQALSIPHPRMHERAFVLAPLTEIAPSIVIPGKGSAKALLAACVDQAIERIP